MGRAIYLIPITMGYDNITSIEWPTNQQRSAYFSGIKFDSVETVFETEGA